MGHDFAGRGDVPGLIDAAGVEEESDLGGAAIDGVEGGGSFAFVGEIFFGGGGGEGDAEGGLEDAVVEEHNVEFALERPCVALGRRLTRFSVRPEPDDVGIPALP